MRTFLGIVGAFCLASILILAGEWAYTMVAAPSLQAGQNSFALVIVLASLIYIAFALIMGGYLAAIIDGSPEVVAGYSVLQLFFGVWFFREFWTTGFIWYKPTAVFLVIPCAMLGRYIAVATDAHSMRPDTAASSGPR